MSTFLIEGLLESKNPMHKSYQGIDSSLDPVGHSKHSDGHFGLCSHCGVAGGERVSQALQGRYLRLLVYTKCKQRLIIDYTTTELLKDFFKTTQEILLYYSKTSSEFKEYFKTTLNNLQRLLQD